jgi:hypothetical protein
MPGRIDYLGPFQDFIDEGLQQRLARLGDDNSDIRITGDGIDYRLGQCREWKTTECACLIPPEIISYYLTNNLGDEVDDDLNRVKLVQITDDDMAVFVDDCFRYTLRLK